MKKIIFLLLFIFSLTIVIAQNNLYKEKYRPRFHFSPAKNWTNDPNGLVISMANIICFINTIPMVIGGGI